MILQYWKHLFEDNKSEGEIFVARFFAVFNFLIIISVTLALFVNVGLNHNTSRGGIIIGLLVVLAVNLGAVFIHKSIRVAAFVLALSVAVFLNLLVLNFNINQNSPAWYGAAIIVMMFLLGRRLGSVIAGLFVASQCVLYIFFVNPIAYPASPFILTVSSEIVIVMLLWFYLGFNENKDKEVLESQNKLKVEVEKTKAAETQLHQNIADLKVKTDDAERNKTALLNVLDDLNSEKAKLEEREQELIAAQRIGKFGSFNWNLKNNAITWSKESFIIHGFTPTESLIPPPMETYFAAIHPDDRAAAQKSSADSVMVKGENEFTYRVIWPDQTIHWVKVSSNAVFDDQGAPIFLKGTFQDITREVEDKRKIEQEKAKDEAILSSIADGLLMLDKNGVITHMNGTGERIFGWRQDEIIGKAITEIFPIKARDGKPISDDQRPAHLALVSKRPTSGVYIYTRKDGTDFPASISVSPIIQNDEVQGIVEVFRDVTREENIDRMKTEFISLASHQLRTPLSAIKWSLEMLLAGDLGEFNPEQKEMMTNVDKSNERMITLVNALLNVSRIESGRIIIDPKPTDMKKLVETVISEVKLKIDAKHQTLILSANENLPLVNIDPDLIRQVYLNLLTNANKYTPDNGDIHIFISAKDDEIISQVTDSGYGIPRAEQGKVFEKFYRGQNIIKQVTDGNGLGLYLVKAIVESSGGRIWFTSEENKGTSFFFALPKSGSIAKVGEVKLDQ